MEIAVFFLLSAFKKRTSPWPQLRSDFSQLLYNIWVGTPRLHGRGRGKEKPSGCNLSERNVRIGGKLTNREYHNYKTSQFPTLSSIFTYWILSGGDNKLIKPSQTSLNKSYLKLCLLKVSDTAFSSFHLQTGGRTFLILELPEILRMDFGAFLFSYFYFEVRLFSINLWTYINYIVLILVKKGRYLPIKISQCS